MGGIRHECAIRCTLAIVVGLSLVGCGGGNSPQPQRRATGDAASLAGKPDANSYVTSTACRPCHAEHYESWHATYHRTMTQEPTSETIQGEFDGRIQMVNGYPCKPFRHGEKYFMHLVDPQWDEQEIDAGRDPRRKQSAQQYPPAIIYAVDRVTGSHHQQVYLSKAPDGGYHTLPLVWDIHRRRWITRSGSFLGFSSDGLYQQTKLWNKSCIYCHNTGPNPGLQPEGAQHVWKSNVVELGIACEACHGPGGLHVRRQQDLAASTQGVNQPPDKPLLVNPSRLPKEQSVLVCARCHGKMVPKKEFDPQCLANGDFFESGRWDFVQRYDHPSHTPTDDFHESREGNLFWSDGTPRTSALEYQGILLSPCYQLGDLTCLSCHSMHRSDPNDQLRFGDSLDLEISFQNRACTQCHQAYETEEQLNLHTHHVASSSGSLCYNCHMPFQAYTLLKRLRSHRITTPAATQTAASGIPNACNQCHVDKTLEWTNNWLSSWKDTPAHPLKPAHTGVATTIAHALAGHALQRALAVEQLGDDENFALAGIDWRGRVLIESLEDDYSAVRLLGYQALRKLPGYEDFNFDYIGTEDERRAQLEEARDRWLKVRTASAESKLRQVLGGSPDSTIDELVDDLIKQRNTVHISVAE